MMQSDRDAVAYTHSEVESRRFRRSVGRIDVPASTDPTRSLAEVLDQLTAAPDDVVILRYPAERVTWNAALRRSGRDLIFAEVITTWRLSLSRARARFSNGWPAAGTSLVDATEVPAQALQELVASTFDRFANHYAANPLFDADDIVAGYTEWVFSTLERERGVCVVGSGGPVGFGTFATRGREAEIFLGGVVPEARLTRAALGMLTHIEDAAREAGCRFTVLRTQAHNQPMQRLLVGSGYVPTHSATTVHAVRAGLLYPVRR